jgi:hypothetical protein
MTAAIKEYIGTWILWNFTRPLWLIDRAWLWTCSPDEPETDKPDNVDEETTMTETASVLLTIADFGVDAYYENGVYVLKVKNATFRVDCPENAIEYARSIAAARDK